MEHFPRIVQALEAGRTRNVAAWLVLATVLTSMWGVWMVVARVTVSVTSHDARVEIAAAAHSVQSLVAGRVAEVHVRLGEHVESGTPLIEIDAADALAELAIAETSLGGKQAELEIIALSIELARGASTASGRLEQSSRHETKARARSAAGLVAAARRKYAASERLHALGVVPDEVLAHDADELKRFERRAEVEQKVGRGAQVRVELQMTDREQRRSDLEAEHVRLTAAVHAEQLQLQRTQRRVREHTIRSPSAGRVAVLPTIRNGVVVKPGDPVATVVPGGRHFAVALFSASDAVGRLRVGQPAQIRLDGYSWAQFGTVAATVARLAPQTRDQSRRVELEILDVPPGVELEHGLPGVVVVDVESISPLAAVLRAAGAQVGGDRRAANAALEAPQ